MDIFSSSVDLMRLVFLIGAVLALAYKKRFGITPGGIIVPGVLTGILFTSFLAFIITFAITGVCWAVNKMILSKYALSNRWSSLLSLSISVTLGLLAMLAAESLSFFDNETLLLSLVVPGLITISSKKYGIKNTLFSTSLVTSLTGFIGLILSKVIPYHVLTALSVQLAVYTPLTLSNPYVVLPISLIISILVYYRFGLRGGGYLIGPFLAVIFMSSIIQSVLILLGVVISYLIVKLTQKHTLFIGLERFVISLFCGYFVITAMDLIATVFTIEGYRPSPLVLIIAVAVLTNDLSLQPLRASLKRAIIPSYLFSIVTRLAV